MATAASHYLAILKASYDYTSQSEDEITIKEDQLLFLLEKVDEDWWKVKIKGDTQDDEGPVGLVPAAYVEQAEHSSLVKAAYDYDAAAEGELSVKEDEILLVFETEGEWILVQSQTREAAGYVPGNYVEATSGEAAAAPISVPAAIVVPESPPARPSISNYEDPAARVQAHKLSADDIKTWSVSELDKKGKKKKGTLGVGNGSLFFASESDKAAVQKWQTSDVTDAHIDRPKHITVVIGGPNPVTLHFHAGSKDNSEEILAKVKSSKAISTPATNGEAAAEAPRKVPPPPDANPRSVHFSSTSPVIIPPAPSVQDEEEEEEISEEDLATVLYDFKADGEDELSVKEGEQLLILERDGDEWWKCRNAAGAEGVVPAQYLEAAAPSANGASGSSTASRAQPPPESDDDDDEEEAERLRLAQEEAEREEAEKQKREAEAKRKKQEAQRKAKEAAAAAEAERQKRLEREAKEAARAAKIARQEEDTSASSSSNSKRPASSSAKQELTKPSPDKTRTWHDRSGQFRVDAAFLGFTNGKLRLHKTNGVVVEVPAEKMSTEDMKFVEHLMAKKQRSALSDDDVPLSVTANLVSASSSSNNSSSNAAKSRGPPPPKKAPQIDWFDFFLTAGCDLDDCTRYAASFERDKMDETLLPDITESTMRSLGLKEGDIIRVKKAIEKRKPTDNLNKPSPYIQEQIRRDEELARQLQAGLPAPNLFSSGPGGALKPRRGRPQPKGSLPLSNVDIKAIDSASDSIQRTSSPRSSTPVSAQPAASNGVQAPPRSSSALAAPVSGFDDDAWAPRPSSTKPLVGTPPSQTPRAPSVPPAPAPAPAAQAALAPAPAPAPAPTAPAAATATTSPPSLAKTTESDIFDQLARLSELRKTSSPAQPPQQQFTPQPVVTPPTIQTPPNFQMGMGMGVSNSPVPMGQLQAQAAPQPYNGPRGPFAPVPANQTLLQPLIPTQTGFNSFIPTRAPQQPPALPPMQTGMLQPTTSLSPPPQLSPMMLPQQTGMMLPQQTGMPMNGSGFVQGSPFNGGTPMLSSFQNGSGFGGGQMQPLQPQYTSFNPNGNAFNAMASPVPPVPPMPPAPATNNTPANIFASMKSGTFEDDNNQTNSGPRPADMYDALRTNPAPIGIQPTGWGQPTYGMGFQR